MMKCLSVLLTALVILSCNTPKKVTTTKVDKKPLSDTAWVQMMDDPNTNYFDAVENFENFWKGKVLPKTEEEKFGEANEEVKKEKEELRSQDMPAVKYFFEYKKFKHWQKDVLPYVQPNGRILTIEERMDIRNKQLEQEKKSGNK
jgi:hypothetical protein